MKFALTFILPLAVSSFGGIAKPSPEPTQLEEAICENVMEPSTWGLGSFNCMGANCDLKEIAPAYTHNECVPGYCRQYHDMPEECVSNYCFFNDMNGLCENGAAKCGRLATTEVDCLAVTGMEVSPCFWENGFQLCTS